MYIITQQQGVTLGHKVGDVTLKASSIEVVIESESLELMVGPDGNEFSAWSNTFTLPLIDLGTDYKLAVANFLASEGQYFQGGTIVSDEEFAFTAKRLDKLMKVKKKRGELRSDIAPTSFGPINIDPESRDNISGMLDIIRIAEELGQPLTEVEFTMANDLDYLFTVTEFKQVALQVGMFVQDCHRRKRQLDADIYAATTIEELDAIDIEAGWPAP